MIDRPLTPEDFRRLVKLLSGLETFQTIPGRQMVLANAGLSQFAPSLDFNLAADAFSNQLVRRLESYGTLAQSGERALWPLLREVRGMIEGRLADIAFIDSLLQGPPQGQVAGQRDQVRVLFLGANPRGTDPLRLDEEVRTIDARIREAEFRDRFDLRQHWAVRVSELSGLLLRHRPRIVHFSGHGSTAREIILENEAGETGGVPPGALADLFRILKDDVRLVVLNACFSEVQAWAIAEVVDCVVGTTQAIGDGNARHFSSGLYRGLAYGRSAKTAFELGKNEIDLSRGKDADLFHLLTRPNVDAAKMFV